MLGLVYYVDSSSHVLSLTVKLKYTQYYTKTEAHTKRQRFGIVPDLMLHAPTGAADLLSDSKKNNKKKE